MLANPLDDLAIHERLIRSIHQLQSNASRFFAYTHVEIRVALHHRSGIVQLTADVEHGQGAGPELVVQTTGFGG